jgi:putative ABC transport system permease protein
LLVISELALSLMLLIGAGLLLRSFVRLESVPPGFNTEHVLFMQVAVTGREYRQDKTVTQFFRRSKPALRAFPACWRHARFPRSR